MKRKQRSGHWNWTPIPTFHSDSSTTCFKEALRDLNSSVRQADVLLLRHVGGIKPATADLHQSLWHVANMADPTRCYRVQTKEGKKEKVMFHQWCCGSPAESVFTSVHLPDRPAAPPWIRLVVAVEDRSSSLTPPPPSRSYRQIQRKTCVLVSPTTLR